MTFSKPSGGKNKQQTIEREVVVSTAERKHLGLPTGQRQSLLPDVELTEKERELERQTVERYRHLLEKPSR